MILHGVRGDRRSTLTSRPSARRSALERARSSNAPTVLHWDAELAKTPENTCIDYDVALERVEPGQFRILIVMTPSGDFAA